MEPDRDQRISLNGRILTYRLVQSKTARKLRVRVGVRGVEVVRPEGKSAEDVEMFLKGNSEWVFAQIERVERLRNIRKPSMNEKNKLLLQGIETPVYTEDIARRRGTNKVILEDEKIIVAKGKQSETPLEKTLENWLRKRAREVILSHLKELAAKIGETPNRVYIMDQKTKWGNCSALRNLSFNWRLIMAPEFVLEYIVAHETVHLKIPDHSKRFWLTLQSICPKMDFARQWLVANSERLNVKLDRLCRPHKDSLSAGTTIKNGKR